MNNRNTKSLLPYLKLVIGNEFTFFTLILIGLWELYRPLLFVHTTTSIDFPLVVTPLENIYSLSGYFKDFAHKILDIQPIRDLSLMIDVLILRKTGIRTYELHNLIVWFFCVVLVYKLLLQFKVNCYLTRVLTIIYAINPLFVSTIASAANRKHLLSYLFILLATIYTIKWNENKKHSSWPYLIKIPIFYTLSLYSQPITIFWPLWFIFYFTINNIRLPSLTSLTFEETIIKIKSLINEQKVQLKKYACMFFLLSIIAIITAAINSYYYAHAYLTSTAVEKYSEGFDLLGIKFLVLGRAFFQLLLPYRLVLFYNPGSWPNIIGLIILPLFYFLFHKIFGITKTILWGMFFFLPLLTVLYKSTSVFLFDSYLLLSSLGYFVMLLLLLAHFFNHFFHQLATSSHQLTFIIFSILIVIISYKTHNEILLRKDYIKYSTTCYEREPSCQNIYFHAVNLWSKNDHKNALPITYEFINNGCYAYFKGDGAGMEKLFALAVYFDPSLPLNKKVIQLSSIQDRNIYSKILLAALYIDNYEYRMALDIFLELIKDPGLKLIPKNDFAIKKIVSYCQNNVTEHHCQQIFTLIDKKLI